MSKKRGGVAIRYDGKEYHPRLASMQAPKKGGARLKWYILGGICFAGFASKPLFIWPCR
jgi:hypothetical protein